MEPSGNNEILNDVTDKVIDNVSDSMLVGDSQRAETEALQSLEAESESAALNVSEDTVNVSEEENISANDTEGVPGSDGFKAAMRHSAENARRVNLTLAVFSMMIFMALVIFLTAVLQIESTFIISAHGNYEANESNYHTENRVYDCYREECTVSVSFEGGQYTEFVRPLITVGELAVSLYPETADPELIYEYNYPSDTLIEDGMKIKIDRVEYRYSDVVDVYPFNVVNNEIQTIPKGTRVVTTVGVNGSVEHEVKEKYVNGVLSDAFIVNTTVLKEPIDEVANVGVGGTFTNKRGKVIEYSYYVDVLATAYGVDTGWGGDSKYTFTGTIAREGVIAVDPEVIPFGSTVYITGEGGDTAKKYGDMGVFYAEDAGNAILGSRVDIYMGDDLERQTQFGKRNMRVYILELPEEESEN